MAQPTHFSHPESATNASCWQQDFLVMLPKIEEQARYKFRHLKGDHQDEAVQEVICNCCLAFARLWEQGRAEAATWSTLARYGIAQVRVGRRVGAPLNIKDTSSRHCQLRKQVDVQSLHRWDPQNEEWSEMVVEDRHSTPADLAAFRIDFREFLRSLSRRNRQIALKLSKGESTHHVAGLFRISSARVSQLRRELWEAWQEFHGELAAVI
jgi:hypothetical protein